MKTTLLVVLLLCVVPLAGIADNSLNGGFVGGGGPMPTLLFLDLKDLNGAITETGYPHIGQVLFANGGGGYGGELEGLRVGGFGIGGDSVSTSGMTSVSFDLSYGGILVEKAVQSDEDFTVVLGTLLGFGNLNLRFVSGLPETFKEAVVHPFISSMSKGFYAVQPYIAFESKPCSWMWARLQLGFLWTLADDWFFEDAEFAGPPRTVGGLTASLMIRFGHGDGRLPLENIEAALDEPTEELEPMEEIESVKDPTKGEN